MIDRFEIVELAEFKGNGAILYSIALNDDNETLFDRFIEENEEAYADEINFIVNRLQVIARLGARPEFFKANEGSFGKGDGIEALYDLPNSNLRLYCIRYGTVALILGGGGHKPKTIRALQEDPKLTKENYLLRELSGLINSAIKDGNLYWDGNFMAGTLVFGNLE